MGRKCRAGKWLDIPGGQKVWAGSGGLHPSRSSSEDSGRTAQWSPSGNEDELWTEKNNNGDEDELWTEKNNINGNEDGQWTWPNFIKHVSTKKLAKHIIVLLSRIRLLAQNNYIIVCMLWLVPTQLIENYYYYFFFSSGIFCKNSFMKLGHVRREKRGF